MPEFYNQFPVYVGNFIVTNYLPDPGSDYNCRAQLPTAAWHSCPQLQGTVAHSCRALLTTYLPNPYSDHSCKALVTTAVEYC